MWEGGGGGGGGSGVIRAETCTSGLIARHLYLHARQCLGRWDIEQDLCVCVCVYMCTVGVLVYTCECTAGVCV